MSLNEMYKMGDKLADYFDRRSSSPSSLAYYMSNLPEGVQEAIFDFALAFLDSVAEKDVHNYGGIMAKNRRLANRLKEFRGRLGNHY